MPGDVAHLLSGECPALQPNLANTLHHIFETLAPHPCLLQPVLSALHGDRDTTTAFFLDPSSDPSVIKLVQQHGQSPVLHPLFRVSRAWVWCAHRTRMRLLGLEQFILKVIFLCIYFVPVFLCDISPSVYQAYIS